MPDEFPMYEKNWRELVGMFVREYAFSLINPVYKALRYLEKLPESDVDFPQFGGDTVILGLDGLDHQFIEKYRMERLYELLERYPSESWVCDTISHTAPSWTTIFTGSKPEEHGIYEFYKIQKNAEWKTAPEQKNAERNSRKDIKSLLLWEKLENRGFDVSVHDVPCTLPPLSYNSSDSEFFFPDSLNKLWKHTSEEMKWVMENGSEILVTVIETPDKINHKVDKRTLTKFEARKMTSYLDCFLEKVTESFDNWIFLSDHGSPGSFYRLYDRKVNIPAHHRDGVIVTNMGKPPLLMSEFYKWFLEVLE